MNLRCRIGLHLWIRRSWQDYDFCYNCGATRKKSDRMGTTIINHYTLQIDRFWGGDERGVCYQINVGSEFLQVTKAEMKGIIAKLLESLTV